MQEFTQKGGVRPFGVSLLMAGYDTTGPSLYQVDPSGAYFPWKATAIGKNMINAKTFLEKRFDGEMEIEDAVHTAILTLKEGFEGVRSYTRPNVCGVSSPCNVDTIGRFTIGAIETKYQLPTSPFKIRLRV
ncbi:Protein phosphatase PP2A regulatory subunit B [Massospora cicadina]|nr:Protein phosphatase PP2A regulatory subunit B [Massospora cicadina]